MKRILLVEDDTLIIFLTANDQESGQIRGYEAGAVDDITKPFSVGTLLRKIRAMFAMLKHREPARDISGWETGGNEDGADLRKKNVSDGMHRSYGFHADNLCCFFCHDRQSGDAGLRRTADSLCPYLAFRFDGAIWQTAFCIHEKSVPRNGSGNRHRPLPGVCRAVRPAPCMFLKYRKRYGY